PRMRRARSVTPPHVADGNGHAMRSAVAEPANLVVLQAIAGALHFDHSIAPLARPELDEIRKAAAIGLHVLQDAKEAALEMRRRQALQSDFEQLRRKQAPRHERGLDARLAQEGAANGMPIFAARELRKAQGELTLAAPMEVRRVQVRRRGVELVE